jgi:hypothetical protein
MGRNVKITSEGIRKRALEILTTQAPDFKPMKTPEETRS